MNIGRKERKCKVDHYETKSKMLKAEVESKCPSLFLRY